MPSNPSERAVKAVSRVCPSAARFAFTFDDDGGSTETHIDLRTTSMRNFWRLSEEACRGWPRMSWSLACSMRWSENPSSSNNEFQREKNEWVQFRTVDREARYRTSCRYGSQFTRGWTESRAPYSRKPICCANITREEPDSAIDCICLVTRTTFLYWHDLHRRC